MDKQYFKLSNSIAFYVPSTELGSKKISKANFTKRTNDIAKILSQWFGGCNASLINGFYTMESTGELVNEANNKILAFCDSESLESHRVDLINLAHEKCKEWTQETIGLEINGTFYLID